MGKYVSYVREDAQYNLIKKYISNAKKNDLIRELEKFKAQEWLEFEELNLKDLREIALYLFEEFLAGRDNTQVDYVNGLNAYGKGNGDGEFYGSNLHFLTEMSIGALKKCKLAKTEGKTINFLDVGCGSRGQITWKALLAGCKVTALDVSFKNKYFSRIFDKSIESIIPENLLKNLAIVSSSIQDLALNKNDYEDKFDVVHASRVLHFQLPSKIDAFIDVIYNITKPKGEVHLSVDGVKMLFDIKNCENIYKGNKAQNAVCPGYIYVKRIEAKGKQQDKYCVKTDIKKIESLEEFPQHQKKDLANGVTEYNYMLNTYGEEDLVALFKDSNFEVIESFGLGQTEEFGQQQLFLGRTDNLIYVGIILEKPNLMLEFNEL